jgi:hypothetical protein
MKRRKPGQAICWRPAERNAGSDELKTIHHRFHLYRDAAVNTVTPPSIRHCLLLNKDSRIQKNRLKKRVFGLSLNIGLSLIICKDMMVFLKFSSHLGKF